jgi:hypothetical protein
VLRERRAVLAHDVGAGLGDLPGDVDAGRFDDAAHRGGDLGPDAVPGDQRHCVLGHRTSFRKREAKTVAAAK